MAVNSFLDLPLEEVASDDARQRANALELEPSRGVHAMWPSSTPKYIKGNGEPRLADNYTETMARLFIEVPDVNARNTFIQSLPAESQGLAKVLLGTGGRGSAQNGVGFVEFMLQSAQHSLTEKIQVVENLADDHVLYAFGAAPPVFNYSGVLINSKQDDQVVKMFKIYRDMIRAFQLAKRKQLVHLRYDGMIVSGVMLAFSWTLGAENEMIAPFSFQLSVSKITLLQPSNPPGYVVLDDEFASGGVKLGNRLLGDLSPRARRLSLQPKDANDAQEEPPPPEMDAPTGEGLYELDKRLSEETADAVNYDPLNSPLAF